MKALLAAIQTALRGSLTQVRDSDVFISPDLGWLPPGGKFPCVGIKDGTVTRRELAGEMLEVVRRVDVAVYVQLHKPGAVIMGDASVNQLGILDMAAAVLAVLDENQLGIPGTLSAYSPAEPASEMFLAESEMIQRKIVTFEYQKEESRP